MKNNNPGIDLLTSKSTWKSMTEYSRNLYKESDFGVAAVTAIAAQNGALAKSLHVTTLLSRGKWRGLYVSNMVMDVINSS